MPDELLAIYLTDHLAGANAGSARMRRLADHEASASDAATLAAIASQIEEDRETLQAILVDCGVAPRWYKSAIAWIAERIGLLKTNGRVVRRSPLTSVVELEFMRMAVTGKMALWQALKHTAVRHEFDLDELLERAVWQLHGLEAAHELRASIVGRRGEP